MPSVDPHQFSGKPLLLVETTASSSGDFTIRCAGHLVGRILRADLTGDAESWFWTVTGPYLPEELRPSDGRASSLATAKKAIRLKFDAWLQWAIDQGKPVPWHGVQQETPPATL